MKRSIVISVFFLAALAGVGCRAQQPVTAWQVNLTWTAPSGCSSASPCTYPISRATVASAGSACPATTGTAYALVGTSATQATALSDITVVPGQFYCYIAQTVQGGATGDPSVPSAVVSVPVNPGIPTAPVVTLQAH